MKHDTKVVLLFVIALIVGAVVSLAATYNLPVDELMPLGLDETADLLMLFALNFFLIFDVLVLAVER